MYSTGVAHTEHRVHSCRNLYAVCEHAHASRYCPLTRSPDTRHAASARQRQRTSATHVPPDGGEGVAMSRQRFSSTSAEHKPGRKATHTIEFSSSPEKLRRFQAVATKQTEVRNVTNQSSPPGAISACSLIVPQTCFDESVVTHPRRLPHGYRTVVSPPRSCRRLCSCHG